MPEQGLSGLTAAKVQQKFELTKYFGKKMQFYCKILNRNNIKTQNIMTHFNFLSNLYATVLQNIGGCFAA